MLRQTTFKLLYDALYSKINKKGTCIIYNHSMYTYNIDIKNFIYLFFFTIYIMESTAINNNINVIKEVRKLFNHVRSNLSNEETKRIRKKTL